MQTRKSQLTAANRSQAVIAKLRPKVTRTGDTRTQGEVVLTVLTMATAATLGLYFIRSIVGPVFLALTLVITVRPGVQWLARKGLPRWLAATTGILVIYAFIAAMVVAMVVAISQFAMILPDYASRFTGFFDQLMRSVKRFGVDEDWLLQQARAFDTSKLLNLAQSVVDSVTSTGSLMLLMLLTVFFLAFDTSSVAVRARSLRVLKPGIYDAVASFCRAVRSYWMVSTIFGLIVAVFDVIALWILGVPLAITWGVLSFITNYVPNIGFVLGVIPPALLALVTDGPWTALWVVVAYSVLNFVIQSLVQPKFTGDAVGLNTTTSFLSLAFWTMVIGGLGSILAVPLTLFAKCVLIDSDPRSRWLSVFLTAGDEPFSEPDRVEQDLLSATK
jgi:membrane protein